MAAFLSLCICVLCRTVHALMQLWCSEGTYMFLAGLCWDRHVYAIWAVPPVSFGAWFSMNRLGKREFHRGLSFVSSSAFSNFQVTLSTNVSLHCPGVGCLLHHCTKLHLAVWSSSRSLSSCLRHWPGNACTSSPVICSSPKAALSFGQRTFAWAHAQICCLSKGQSHDWVRKSCTFQAGLGMFVPDST